MSTFERPKKPREKGTGYPERYAYPALGYVAAKICAILRAESPLTAPKIAARIKEDLRTTKFAMRRLENRRLILAVGEEYRSHADRSIQRYALLDDGLRAIGAHDAAVEIWTGRKVPQGKKSVTEFWLKPLFTGEVKTHGRDGSMGNQRNESGELVDPEVSESEEEDESGD